MCTILFMIAIVSVLLLSAAAFSADEIDKCASAVDHFSQRQCLELTALLANNEMMKAENKVLGALQRWDQDHYWRDKALERFKHAATAFRDYREQLCNFEASIAAGGNAAGDLRLECIYRLAKERAKLLLEQEKNIKE